MNADEYLVHWVNVVVAARFHNPSILNPDFLRLNKIVPADWKVSEVLTTRPFSFVEYKNKVRISVDEQRFEAIHAIAGGFPNQSPIYDMASKYVVMLEHVNYTGVGLNWQLTKKHDNPTSWITSRFLKAGKWTEGEPRLVKSDISLFYTVGDSMCNLRVSPGVVQVSESHKYEAIELNCNFHHDLTDATAIRERIVQWQTKQEFLKNQLLPLLEGD